MSKVQAMFEKEEIISESAFEHPLVEDTKGQEKGSTHGVTYIIM